MLTSIQCINQRDDLERTHQVLMMREIYASASDVIIFLGDGLEHRTERVGAYPEPAKQVIFKCDDTDDEIVRDILGKWTKRRSSTPRITVREIFCLIRMVASKEYIELLESIPMEYSERLFEGLRMLLLTPWYVAYCVV